MHYKVVYCLYQTLSQIPTRAITPVRTNVDIIEEVDALLLKVEIGGLTTLGLPAAIVLLPGRAVPSGPDTGVFAEYSGVARLFPPAAGEPAGTGAAPAPGDDPPGLDAGPEAGLAGTPAGAREPGLLTPGPAAADPGVEDPPAAAGEPAGPTPTPPGEVPPLTGDTDTAGDATYPEAPAVGAGAREAIGVVTTTGPGVGQTGHSTVTTVKACGT